MKKKLLVILMAASMLLAMTACKGANLYIGHWTIKEVEAGDIIMTAEDMEDMGLDAGFVKMQKSGIAVVNLLGDEYEGSWVLADDEQSATITYGDDMTGTAVLEDKTMTFTDAQGSIYKMQRF